MTKRLDYIDRARGSLIILSVVGHIWQAGCVHNLIYSFHMPAFFIISGMLMCHTRSYEKKYSDFLLGRLYAFGIPFIFFEILGVLTDIIRHGATLNINGYLFNTLTLRYNDSNMWFIISLFLIEAIFAAAKKTLKRDWSVGILCAFLFALSILIVDVENRYIKAFVQACRYLFFFSAGYFGKEYFQKKNSVVMLMACIIPPLTAGLFGKRMDWSLSLANAAFLVSGVAGAYAVLQLCKWKLPDPINSLLTSAGRNSIIIYGTHHIIYATVGVLLGITDFATTPLWAGVVMLLIVAALELPTIYIINRWLPFLAGKRYKKEKIMHS